MKAKSRMSAHTCTNATGTFKLPIVVIGKAKESRCFRGKRVPFLYLSQANAWSNAKTFKKWWDYMLRKVPK